MGRGVLGSARVQTIEISVGTTRDHDHVAACAQSFASSSNDRIHCTVFVLLGCCTFHLVLQVRKTAVILLLIEGNEWRENENHCLCIVHIV